VIAAIVEGISIGVGYALAELVIAWLRQRWQQPPVVGTGETGNACSP
jgi:Na+-translocating ferredoxin:NAD+ oxidoreductase RnfA subunit